MTCLDDDRLRAVLDRTSRSWHSHPGSRDAAVLAPVLARDGRDHLLFTQRRPDLNAHPGQMSFPGGSREADEDALACALRECREEIGLGAEHVDIFGQLADRHSRTGFLVRAFVGRVDARAVLAVDPREVETIVAIPVADLLLPDRWTWRPVPGSERARRSPSFHHGAHEVWGLTAMLTLDVLGRLGMPALRP